jgi:hypothetical protein
LGILQRILGTVSLDGPYWLEAVVLAVALLIITEIIKFFLRQSQKSEAQQ